MLVLIKHPNEESYSHQRTFIVAIEGYAYLVPYVETDKGIFLKTVIPSRLIHKEEIQLACANAMCQVQLPLGVIVLGVEL